MPVAYLKESLVISSSDSLNRSRCCCRCRSKACLVGSLADVKVVNVFLEGEGVDERRFAERFSARREKGNAGVLTDTLRSDGHIART